MVKLEFCNVEKVIFAALFISSTIRSPLQCCYKLNSFYINIYIAPKVEGRIWGAGAWV